MRREEADVALLCSIQWECVRAAETLSRIPKDRTIGSSHEMKHRKLQRYKKSLLSFREVICWHGVPKGQRISLLGCGCGTEGCGVVVDLAMLG